MEARRTKPHADIRITVLGTRGSVPVFGDAYAIFGGSTSCYLVEAGGTSIFLDAGSGLVNAPVDFPNPPAILLSHLHVDHLLGLGSYERLSQRGALTNLYVPAESVQAARNSIARLYDTPLWPLKLTAYPGDLWIDALPQRMRYGAIEIDTMEGNHTSSSLDSIYPKGCICIKLSYAGKSLVYATDFEHNVEASKRLAWFSRDVDLLLYDAQYDEEDYEAHRGFGHSTMQEGLRLKERSGAKRLLLIHHDPHSTDAKLLARTQALGDTNVHFAREGEVIEL